MRHKFHLTGALAVPTMLTAIGLMSGTSLDGVDVALIETDGRKVQATLHWLSAADADRVRRDHPLWQAIIDLAHGKYKRTRLCWAARMGMLPPRRSVSARVAQAT